MIREKAQAILLARETGAAATQLARQYGVTPQRVSAIVRDATAFVNRVDMDLMVARKTDEVCVYLIPVGVARTTRWPCGSGIGWSLGSGLAG